jgi:hypothetical protein
MVWICVGRGRNARIWRRISSGRERMVGGVVGVRDADDDVIAEIVIGVVEAIRVHGQRGWRKNAQKSQGASFGNHVLMSLSSEYLVISMMPT